MTRGSRSILGFGLMLVAIGCGGGTPAARSADDEGKTAHDDPSWYDSGSEESGSSSAKPSSKAPTASEKQKKTKPTEGTAAEPTFTEGMSVNDAINAVPQGWERVNIDPEDLNRPLLDPEFYKSCKLAQTQHFEIKFAVWDGRAVGIDIKTTPANKNAESCLRGLVAKNVWRDKAKSLNIGTVTF